MNDGTVMNEGTVQLSGGTRIPSIGLGTWPMDNAESRRVVADAIAAGYRHVDTAENYGNERGVGLGIADSGIDRSELWVTTKFNRAWHADPAPAVAASLERLGLDYADLVLIHWPNPDADRYVDAWRGLIALREQGVVRAIGTSNFKPAHIDRLIAETGVAPEINQLELHPYLDRAAERAYHAAHGIVTEAWSPLGRGNGLLTHPLVVELAARHAATSAQVLLAWDLALGLVTIPKSADPGRLRQNLDAADVALAADEVAALTALEPPPGVVAVDSDVFGH